MKKNKLVIREPKTELMNPEIKGTPAILISQAIAKGSNLEQLEKLLAFRERLEANESKKAFHKAMAEFKANLPQIMKEKKVSYEAGSSRVKYSYASLFNIVDKVTPIMSKYGLSIAWTHRQDEKNIFVTCRITHEFGYSEETTIGAPADTTGAKNAIQAIGSTISYLERYSFLGLIGAATKDQDDDGQTVGKPVVVQPKPKPEIPPKPQTPIPTGIKCHGCDIDITQAEKDYSMKKLNKPLCRNCQRQKF